MEELHLSQGELLLQEVQAAIEARNPQEAERKCRSYLREHPTSHEATFILGHLMTDAGDIHESLRLTHQAIHYNSSSGKAHRALGRAYYALGRSNDAVNVFKQWAAMDPHNPEAQHMLSATTGGAAPLRCSDGYVTQLFNDFSHDFDEMLVRRLGYRGPEVLKGVLDRRLDAAAVANVEVLDAGCGTGLCGPAVRSLAKRLVGVDLAGKMVDVARKLNCYDELVVAELCEFMRARPQSFDVIVSSDVFIYFGDLNDGMNSAYGALRPGGLLVMTVEALVDDGADSFKLTASGRFSHRESYLRKTLAEVGFRSVEIEQATLRRELGKDVPFHVVSACRS
jgi:predicted TPR repeat methyltransferase